MNKKKTIQIYNHPTRKGHCFPLPPTEVENILINIQHIDVNNVYYALKTSKQVILSVYFHGAFSHTPYQSDIWVYSVSPQEKQIARKKLLDEVVPSLIEWLTELQHRDDYWKQKDHNLTFRFINGGIIRNSDEIWQH